MARKPWKMGDHGGIRPASRHAPNWDRIKREVKAGATVTRPLVACQACGQDAWRKRRGKDEFYCTACEG